MPDTLILRAYLPRAALLWVGARLMAAVAFAAAALPLFPVTLSAAAEIVVLSVLLGFADIARRRESSLLGNLGISRSVTGAMFAVSAVAGEVLLSLTVSLAG